MAAATPRLTCKCHNIPREQRDCFFLSIVIIEENLSQILLSSLKACSHIYLVKLRLYVHTSVNDKRNEYTMTGLKEQ